jgi:hypothetical protein
MKALLAALAFAGALAVPASTPETAPPPREVVPSIADLMQEGHNCRTAHIKLIDQQLHQSDANWSDVQTKSRDLIRIGKLLAKNTPPGGSKESWEKFTTLYVANATLMSDAAERKNRDEVTYHTKKLRRMCNDCHTKHAAW